VEVRSRRDAIAKRRARLLVVLFVTYSLLLFSDAILRVIDRQGASVLVRVMGLILCSLAVEIVLTALGVGSWTAGAAH
jgi:multiple antibiotic resistance protein